MCSLCLLGVGIFWKYKDRFLELVLSIIQSTKTDRSCSYLYDKDPEASEGRRSGGGSQSRKALQIGEMSHNSPSHFPALLGKVCNNLLSTHQLFLLV